MAGRSKRRVLEKARVVVSAALAFRAAQYLLNVEDVPVILFEAMGGSVTTTGAKGGGVEMGGPIASSATGSFA